MAPLPKVEKSVVRPVPEASPYEQVELPLATSPRASSAMARRQAHQSRRGRPCFNVGAPMRQRASPRAPRPKRRQVGRSLPNPMPRRAHNPPPVFIERLRRGLAPSASQPQTVAAPPAKGWLRRIRGAHPADKGTGTVKAASTTPPIAGNAPVSGPTISAIISTKD